jgi:hypothetical protein
VVTLGCASVALVVRGCEVDAEADRYHLAALQLLAGDPVADPFHPFGYTLLITLLLPLGLDPLLAGRLWSAAAAGLLLHQTAALAGWLRPGSEPWTRWVLALNPMVYWFGAMASSDMVAAALLTTGITQLVRGPGSQRAGFAFAIGAVLGFGIAVRTFVALALPWLGVAAWHRGDGWRRLGLVGAGIGVGYLPQVVLQWLSGDASGHAVWPNLYLKVVYGFDLGRMAAAQAAAVPMTGWTFLAEHSLAALQLGLADTWSSLTTMLPAMLCGGRTLPSWATVWPLAVLAALAVRQPQDRRRLRALLGLALLLTLATGLLTLPRPRLLLPVLPLLSVLLAAALHGLPAPWLRRLGLAAWLATTAWVGGREFQARLAEEPRAEIAVAQRLSAWVDPPFTILATFPTLDRYVPQRVYGYLETPRAGPAASRQSGRARLQTAGADVLVTGRASHPALYLHLRQSAVPDDFRELVRDDDVVAVVRDVTPTPWIARQRVEPAQPRAGTPWRFELELAPDAELDRIVACGVAVRGPDGAELLVTLTRVAPRHFAEPLPAAAGGDWSLVPFLLRGDGTVQRGRPLQIHVTPR